MTLTSYDEYVQKKTDGNYNIKHSYLQVIIKKRMIYFCYSIKFKKSDQEISVLQNQSQG